MEKLRPTPVTEMLLRWRAGDRNCLDQMVPLVDNELRRIAHRYIMMERRDDTLQTAAIVNEVYLRLMDRSKVDWQNRGHFLGVAARLMRQILVDYARTLHAEKRGGGAQFFSFDEGLVFSIEKSETLVALDDALNDLASFDERKARIVELRYLGGMSIQETADVLDVSPKTVSLEWALAKVWLKRKLSPKGENAA